MKLDRHFVAKPWGRTDLPALFAAPPGERIGEIWYEGAPEGFALLAKYLFTSEKLSVQVHPDDAQARARGAPSGKEECWYVVAAERDAMIGIGTKRPVDADALRAAALAGTIEALLDWRSAAPGDFYYVPAGTIHAIGPGVTLIEIQQAADITYRLYDYGRPRELHLDDAVAVADARPLSAANHCTVAPGDTVRLVDGPPFALRLCGAALEDVPRQRPLLVVPLAGSVAATDVAGDSGVGSCLYVRDAAMLRPSRDARMLVAWPVG